MMPEYGKRDVLRWMMCGALVCLAHGGIAAGVMHWSDTSEPDDPAAAMVIELAPMPVAPANVPAEEIPPGPEQVQADATSANPTEHTEEKVEEKVEKQQAEEVQKDITPAENPEVALAAAPPKPEPKTPPAEEQQVTAPITTAPQAPKAEQAAVAAAPTQGPINASNSTAIPTWRRQIVTRIERNKRYPAAAQARHEHGTAQLAFRLDRQGRVVESHIVRSSGSAALDQETLEIVRRAQPFPAIPAEISGPHVDLTVPIRFNLR